MKLLEQLEERMQFGKIDQYIEYFRTSEREYHGQTARNLDLTTEISDCGPITH